MAPESLIQRQLDAYNARDLQAWLATYAEDAVQLLADGTVLAQDHAQIAARMQERFRDEALHATLVQRTVLGDTVVDIERITRTGARGIETVRMVCMYAVKDGRIARATFAMADCEQTPFDFGPGGFGC